MTAFARIVKAGSLRPGLATVIVVLPAKTIRSCVAMVDLKSNYIQIAFTSGDILSVPTTAAVGVVDPPARRERLRRAADAKKPPPWLRGA